MLESLIIVYDHSQVINEAVCEQARKMQLGQEISVEPLFCASGTV